MAISPFRVRTISMHSCPKILSFTLFVMIQTLLKWFQRDYLITIFLQVLLQSLLDPIVMRRWFMLLSRSLSIISRWAAEHNLPFKKSEESELFYQEQFKNESLVIFVTNPLFYPSCIGQLFNPKSNKWDIVCPKCHGLCGLLRDHCHMTGNNLGAGHNRCNFLRLENFYHRLQFSRLWQQSVNSRSIKRDWKIESRRNQLTRPCFCQENFVRFQWRFQSLFWLQELVTLLGTIL